MTSTPLIAAAAPDEIVAWRAGRSVPAASFLAQVRHVADGLPSGRHVLNLCADRYHFAVALCAAVLAGKISLLPPNHSPELIDRLRELYDDVYVVSDRSEVQTGLRVAPYPQHLPTDPVGGTASEVPTIGDDQVVAHVFTSGSTGLPTAHAKRWAPLVYNVQSEAQRLGIEPGSQTTLVGTVPPQHMYGFESTVMLALQNRIAFDGGSPFYPADIAAALGALPGERILVTTPFHLRLLLAESLPLPAVRLVVSATAPLSLEVAREAEARLGAPLLEIYGCTEAGQLATRRPTAGEVWESFRGVTVSQQPEGGWFAQGGHVEIPTRLSDVLELQSPTHFRLLGRDADMVNVAGKRTSLAHLNHLLCAIPGVIDGAFFNPDEGTRDVARLTAFVVTRELTPREILAQLRRKTDAVFLPRPLHLVDKLPRADTGKLPHAALAELARQCASKAVPGTAGQLRRPTSGEVRNEPPARLASCDFSIGIPDDHPAFAGHFPGQPILPGVVLLAEVLAGAERCLGLPMDSIVIKVTKFHATVAPGAVLVVRLERTDAVIRFTVACGDTAVASGTVALTAGEP